MADGHPVGSSFQVSPGSPAGGSYDSGGDQSPRTGVREQDRFLPIANISRIMKKVLPANGCERNCPGMCLRVHQFRHQRMVLLSRASNKCQREKRKTINGDELFWAMATLGFEDYIDPLKMYLARYREVEGDTKGSAKGADGSARKDGLQPTSTSQGMNYGHSQSQAQHMTSSNAWNGLDVAWPSLVRVTISSSAREHFAKFKIHFVYNCALTLAYDFFVLSVIVLEVCILHIFLNRGCVK